MLPLYLFSILYLSFTILFGVKLRDWDYNGSGRCYNTRLIANRGDLHPGVDIAFLVVTSFYCMATLTLCISILVGFPWDKFFAFWHSPEIRRFLGPSSTRLLVWGNSYDIASSIVAVALLQYPLHHYMVIAMRASNEGQISGDSEDDWGFGQIVALVLALASVFECVKGVLGE
jgi:hypothetical protein